MKSKQKLESVRFVILFFAAFAVLQLTIFISAKKIEPYIAEALHVKPICHIISILTSSVPVSQNGINIVSSNFSLSVDSACNGLDAILLVVSAIIAFRSNILKKIAGIILGSLFLYAFNILRILFLFYSNAFAPDFFDFLHVYAGQTLAVIVGVAFFFLWASWSTSENMVSRVDDEN
ncbi:archaeosortase/exosortase family protein [Desulforegula conservatrix]|uniref:archaeosortase/exosortase family protein n=1 Tax=Desulforegula conservatrix TaxID=153026 RepID=UPI0003FD3002|nr:archaeosortase/exosortase family protein [Desulforegula conservatrix]